MPQGRHTRFKVHLSPEEQTILAHWHRQTYQISAGLARRGRLLQLMAEGHSITAVAQLIGMSRPHIYKWLKRWQAQGLAGLHDKPGRGTRKEHV